MNKYLTNIAFTSRDSEGNIGVGYHNEEVTFTAKDESEALVVLCELVEGARKQRPTDTIGVDGFYRFCPVLVEEGVGTVSELEELDHLITENLAYVCDWQ